MLFAVDYVKGLKRRLSEAKFTEKQKPHSKSI